jgi:hypothetical protein
VNPLYFDVLNALCCVRQPIERGETYSITIDTTIKAAQKIIAPAVTDGHVSQTNTP